MDAAITVIAVGFLLMLVAQMLLAAAFSLMRGKGI